MRACPYPAAVTVPSSATAATCVLSEANETPVAGPITAPPSSGKLARNAYRSFIGLPNSGVAPLRPPRNTPIRHPSAMPRPGPPHTSFRLAPPSPSHGGRVSVAPAWPRHDPARGAAPVRPTRGGTRFLNRDVALLDPHRRRRGGAGRAGRLDRPLAGRQRDDHAVLVHTGDVGAERL